METRALSARAGLYTAVEFGSGTSSGSGLLAKRCRPAHLNQDAISIIMSQSTKYVTVKLSKSCGPQKVDPVSATSRFSWHPPRVSSLSWNLDLRDLAVEKP